MLQNSKLTVDPRKKARNLTAQARLRDALEKPNVAQIYAITPAIARELKGSTGWPGQRALREPRIAELERAMRDGRWNPAASEVTYMRLDGLLYEANGGHRVEAIARGKSLVRTRVNIVGVNSVEEMRALYRVFDDPISARSTSELINSSGLADRLDVKQRTMGKLIAALPILRNEMEPVASWMKDDSAARARNREECFREAPSWATEARLFELATDKAPSWLKQKLFGQGPFACGLYCFRHAPNEAMEFFTGLAETSKLAKTDPRAVLVSNMLAHALEHNNVRASMKRFSTAWNAYMRSQPLKLLRFNIDTPLELLGTPKVQRVRAVAQASANHSGSVAATMQARP